MALSDIVNVSITVQATAPSRVGFGTPLVVAQHTNFAERVREYRRVADMVTDGFTASDPAVRAVTAILSQNPKVNRVLVGRLENDQKQDIKITPTAQNSTLYEVTINASTFQFTSDATATVAEICTGLKTQIDLGSEPVTVTDNATDIDIEANTIPDAFSISVNSTDLMALKNNTPDLGGSSGIADDLAAITIENNEWYTLILTNQGEDVIKAAAAYIETVIKTMIVSSFDTEIITTATTDVASDLKGLNYARTMIIYHPKAITEYPCAGWAGVGLPKDPGTLTWKFKSINGVSSYTLTSSQESNVEGKNCNHYQEVAGIPITQQGVTSSGEFFDITRSIDFCQARLEEYIFGALANADKIPYTDIGVGVVEGQVRAVMDLCVGQTIFRADPEPVVVVPKVADVSTTDRANRLLPDVEFSAQLAGAIHATEITGSVTV